MALARIGNQEGVSWIQFWLSLINVRLWCFIFYIHIYTSFKMREFAYVHFQTLLKFHVQDPGNTDAAKTKVSCER